MQTNKFQTNKFQTSYLLKNIKNFETEAQLIVETDTLPKKSVDRYMLVYDNYQRWKQGNRNLNLNL